MPVYICVEFIYLYKRKKILRITKKQYTCTYVCIFNLYVYTYVIINNIYCIRVINNNKLLTTV